MMDHQSICVIDGCMLRARLQEFMQHFAAGLPHFAMALADLHLVRGGQDPTFVKSQVGAASAAIRSSSRDM